VAPPWLLVHIPGMADEPTNLVLDRLRAIRDELRKMRDEQREQRVASA
jgi:ribosomal protein L19E